jgi:hypothetical protein
MTPDPGIRELLVKQSFSHVHLRRPLDSIILHPTATDHPGKF